MFIPSIAHAALRPALTSKGIGTNGSFQLKLASDTNTGFGIQASTNLAAWTNIDWGFTATNGLLSFQDTNAATLPRMVRAFQNFFPWLAKTSAAYCPQASDSAGPLTVESHRLR